MQSKMSYNKGNPGASSLMVCDEDADSVDLITFDEYLEEKHIDPMTLKYIWVDVEGHEARFFKGAEKALEKSNASVFMELQPGLYTEWTI